MKSDTMINRIYDAVYDNRFCNRFPIAFSFLVFAVVTIITIGILYVSDNVDNTVVESILVFIYFPFAYVAIASFFVFVLHYIFLDSFLLADKMESRSSDNLDNGF